jgi:short-subunit dehydrogenase
MSFMNWKESVCLVTGASSGIGRATAKKIAERGGIVIAVARREERLASLIEELGGAPHFYVVCDVGDLEQVRAMARTVAEKTQRLDALINNAGVPSEGALARSTPEGVERVVKINLLGSIWCTQELLGLIDKAPRGQGGPMIVNVASMAGRIAMPGSAVYTATKFGQVGFSEAVWGEMKQKGIRVMVLEPGFVHTEGFPMDALLASPLTRGLVMDADHVAEALCLGMERRNAEVRVQHWWTPIYILTVLAGPFRRRIAYFIGKMITRGLKI